ncbi:MAG: hypothetical protein RDU20_17275 [Desulfomonilaceae bacterium]|nr:hypothetical protein [Desulfomonilaceae bacterium]
MRASVPNRIDLAGGTTDIYPLYLFMDGGCTVNVGITIESAVEFRGWEKQAIRIASRDLGETVEAPDPDRLPTDGPLGLIGRTVRALPPGKGMEILAHNQAPAGSGLGASSALLVALTAGLLKLRLESVEPEKVVDLAAAIECACIQVPTGKQDHIAAYFGGVSCLEFGCRGFSREELCGDTDDRRRLEEMMILSYTGEGRFSGMNNWDVTKGFIDNDAEIREKLLKIRDVARDLARALRLRDWDEIPRLVDREWDIRRRLAPGISTPRIDRIAGAASAAGASANKVCGAGGGGCMLTLTSGRKRSAVERAVLEAGGTILPFSITSEGLTWSNASARPTQARN